MAIDYCAARKLDIFKRPVHIVPMWNSSLRREVETVWPSINEVQTTAARSGKWAGMDPPEWGPMIKRTFEGAVGKRGQERHVKIELEFPEWCSVTVYRMVNGQRCAFSEPVYWLEAYARSGRGEVPNEMWQKRRMGQLHKNAKAASLRAAFPEDVGNDYTAEEMEGKEIEDGGIVVEAEPGSYREEPTNAEYLNDSIPYLDDPVPFERPEYRFAGPNGEQVIRSASEWTERWRRTIEAYAKNGAVDKLVRGGWAINQLNIDAVAKFDPDAASEVRRMMSEAQADDFPGKVTRPEDMELPQ
jgi:phage recombination protein Bet